MLLSAQSGADLGRRRSGESPVFSLAEDAPRYLFFTGKGGVGKTSLSCATAIALADIGRNVLLVSTDPASNLDEVLGSGLGREPRPIPGVPGLLAANIDPVAAAEAYKRKVIEPLRGVLPDSVITGLDEQLSGACSVEIAAFNEFADLLTSQGSARTFDHVVFDTAPTGHTLRLLSLAGAWEGFIDSSHHGTSCLGPLAGLTAQRELFQSALRSLRSSSTTGVVLVSRPEASALHEADRAREELAQLGVLSQWLVLNGSFHPESTPDRVADALARRGAGAVANMPEGLNRLRRLEIPLVSHPLIGVSALRSLTSPVEVSRRVTFAGPQPPILSASLGSLLDELHAKGHGVIMTLGKGGVGKTHVARTIARELARRGSLVHLTTTDPTGDVHYLGAGAVPSLKVSRIDPAAEVARYRQGVLDTVGSGLNAAGRDLLEEDLRSPCTEEVAVFRAFAAVVAEGKDGFVVIDTAPTGHTVLLLDSAQSYHREVARTSGDQSEEVRNLLPRLRDPDFTHMIIVTLPQATPVHEAERLEDDLRRAGIRPFAWVINQSFLATGTTDPLLTAWAQHEGPYIEEIRVRSGAHCAVLPWFPDDTEGVGVAPEATLLSEVTTVHLVPNESHRLHVQDRG